MKHSKLLSVEVYDFMGYEEARFDFDETNIISFKGYNSSGKTTMLRALGVINSNLWLTKQAKFIRHGQKRFLIKENFSDGVTIAREKYVSGKSAYYMYKDGFETFSTVMNGVYTPVNDVPETISKYLDLIDDTKLNLHLRRGRDKLLLIDTSGRENYDFLSSALKAEELSTASQLLKTDRLKVKQEVSSIEYEIEGYRNLVTKEKVVTPRLVDALEEVDESLNENLDKKARMDTIYEEFDSIKDLKPSIQLNAISTNKVKKLVSLLNLFNDYNGINVTTTLSTIDYDKVIKLIQLINSYDTYNKIQTYPQFKPVDLTKIHKLNELIKSFNDLRKIEQTIADTNASIQENQTLLKNIENWMEEQNVQYIRCKDCGSLQTVDKAHNHG
ncbi:hypothetical protein COF68_04985 [Bacillus toyonensis]|uniref:hypothetical protein n=1 Tax=Bacillus toyonensis TaxID=155322 RepID=UPI000BFBD690|nr:hypothetical protein [Bacillus toyonensis]PHE64203.1 hypothetical protein COF68_04985 [Bacillus toyonensis]